MSVYDCGAYVFESGHAQTIVVYSDGLVLSRHVVSYRVMSCCLIVGEVYVCFVLSQ